VGPCVGWKYEAPSEVVALLELGVVTSNSSAIPVGAAIEPRALFPNNASTSEPFTPVVTEGAAISRVLALYNPACASTGASGSTPKNAEIPPVAPTEEENLQVYDAGSSAVTCLYRSTWLRDVPPILLSRLTRVQPRGEVIVPLADKRALTTATMMSPGIARGLAIESEVPLPVRPVVAPRSAIEPSGVAGVGPNSIAVNGRLLAGGASAPAMAMETRRAVQAAVATCRGRLPNMASASAEVLAIRKLLPFSAYPVGP
jgi:hypothetical protein